MAEEDDEDFLSKAVYDKRRLKRTTNKKETKVKKVLFLLGKKRKSVKKPSDIAHHANELIKRNTTDLNSIKQYFKWSNYAKFNKIFSFKFSENI